MATVGDLTDPRGTKRPYNDLISLFIDVFKPILVPEYYAEVYFPLNIRLYNVYRIVSFFLVEICLI